MSAPEEYYDAYWSPSGFSPVDEELGETLRSVLGNVAGSRHRVIDVGCGDGAKGEWLKRQVGGYIGFDVSHAAVELARRRGLDARVVSDASELPLEDGSVEIALCVEVLEHMFDPLAAVVEIHRVLAPAGTLVVTVPNVASWRNRLDLALLGRWHPGGDEFSVSKPWRDPHLRFFTRRSLQRMLREAGFSNVKVGGVQDSSLVTRMPGLRRLLRSSAPGRATLTATKLVPTVAEGLYAIARK